MRYMKAKLKRRYVGKRKLKSPMKKAITRIVKKQIANNLENKTIYNWSQRDVNYQMDSLDLYEVIPPLSQGTRQGERIGNRVKVKRLRLNMTLALGPPESAPQVDTGANGVYFDVYVFRAIQKPSYDTPVNNQDLDFFLQAGNSSNVYRGEFFNGLQRVNNDRFEILYRKRILMNNVYHKFEASGPYYSGYDQSTNAAKTLSIPLTKKMLKNLKFQDSQTNPTNCAIYATCVATRADGVWDSQSLTATIGKFGCFSELIYEDA